MADTVQDSPTMAPPSLLPTALRKLASPNPFGISRKRRDVATGFFWMWGVPGCCVRYGLGRHALSTMYWYNATARSRAIAVVKRGVYNDI